MIVDSQLINSSENPHENYMDVSVAWCAVIRLISYLYQSFYDHVIINTLH